MIYYLHVKNTITIKINKSNCGLDRNSFLNNNVDKSEIDNNLKKGSRERFNYSQINLSK